MKTKEIKSKTELFAQETALTVFTLTSVTPTAMAE